MAVNYGQEPLVSDETHEILVAILDLIQDVADHVLFNEYDRARHLHDSFTIMQGKEIVLACMELGLWHHLLDYPDISADLPNPDVLVEGPDIVKASWWPRYTATGTDAMRIVVHAQADIYARILWRRLMMEAWYPSFEEEDACIRHFVGTPDGIGIPDPSKVPRNFRLTRDWQYFPKVPRTQVTDTYAAAMQRDWCHFVNKEFRKLQQVCASQQAERDEFNRKHGIVES